MLLSEIATLHYQDTAQVDSPEELLQKWIVPLEEGPKSETVDWYQFQVPSTDEKWVIEAYDFRMSELTLYSCEDGQWASQSVGWSKDYSKRQYDLLNLVLDVPTSEGTGAIYYLRAYDPYGANQEIFLHKQRSFTNYAINENTVLGFFYGVLIIIALYNLILFVYLRERNHLLLVLYILCSALFSFQSDGFGYKYLWANHPQWNNWIDYLWTPLLFTISYLLYALDFIQVRKSHTRLYGAILMVSVLSLVLCTVEFFLPYDLTSLSIAYIIPVLVVFSTSVFLYTKGFLFNRFFIIGNGLVLLSLLIHSTGGHWFHGILWAYSFEFAVSAEILVLSLALADKVRYIKSEKEKGDKALIHQLRDNERLQLKVNIELETKVGERTDALEKKSSELERANSELQELTTKLNSMNEKLDYDNWKLNKSVEQATLERFRGKEVSMDEFNKLFPDELSCLRLLNDLKWESGFSCKKCGHLKFIETDKRFLKKCTKCSHGESATANTLLHRVRIPLPKAFYLTYVSFMGKTYSNDSLADQLGLPSNTVRRFFSKISSKRTETMNLWEDFLRSSDQ